MLKLFVVALLALAWTSTAQATDYPNAVRNPTLEAKLPTAVKVYSTQNTSGSFALLADREIYLGHDVVEALMGRPSPMSFARAAEVLYHEWWHVAFQETNEQNTEAGSWTVLRYMLRTYWNFTPAQAQNSYNQAVQWSPYAPIVYTVTKVDPLLAPC